MATTGAVVPRAAQLPAEMSAMLKGLMPDIRTLLPPDIPFDQFRAALWLELTGRTPLKDCPVHTIRDSAVKAATMGMLPGRDGHILPFRSKRSGGRQEAQWVPNYFGICLALERTGKVARCFAHPVYEGDEFVLDYFANTYSHVPYMVRKEDPGKVLFYYGAVMMKEGPPHVEVMSPDQIDAVKRKAPSHESGPWVTDYTEMARKTVLKRCAKFVRLTPQLAEFFEQEEERDKNDIPPERHQQNIVDLFGDGNGGYSAGTTTPSLWRETVTAHWADMPEPLREQCRAALEDAETTESDGFTLASAVLDTLDHQGTQADG